MAPVLDPRPTGLDPTLAFPVKFCIFNIVWTFLAGEITGNVSQVDRVWTFLPVLYSAYWGLYLPLYGHGDNAWVKEQGISPRAALMALLQVLWSFRLSYNTARRGLFNLKDEDYRWAIFRAKVPAWLFSLFNFGFIALTQNVLLFLMALPAHHALFQQDLPLTTSDYVLAALTIIELAIQFTADNQQYAFQSYKRSRPGANAKSVTNGHDEHDGKPQGQWGANAWPGARIEWTEEDVKRGFITKGLWAWSRHPNFLCEQTFWYLQALFPILAAISVSEAATDPDVITALWPLVPPLALSALFIASTLFTESISRGKYPEYEAYQARVGMFSPTDTLWKGLWLRARGQLDKVNQIVYGTHGKAELLVQHPAANTQLESNYMAPSDPSTSSSTRNLEQVIQGVERGAAFGVDAFPRTPRHASEGRPRDLFSGLGMFSELPALHRLRAHSATSSLPCVSTTVFPHETTPSSQPPSSSRRVLFTAGTTGEEYEQAKVYPSGTYPSLASDQVPTIGTEEDGYSINDAKNDAIAEQSQIWMNTTGCNEQEPAQFPSPLATLPSLSNTPVEPSPLFVGSRTSSYSSIGETVSPPIFCSHSAIWEDADLADPDLDPPSRSELSAKSASYPHVEPIRTAVAWSCRVGNHSKCCGTRALQGGPNVGQYKCCTERGKKAPRCCASFVGWPCERPRVSVTSSAPVKEPKRRRSWYFSSLSSFTSVPGGSKRSKGLFQRPCAPTPLVSRSEFEAHPIISSATDPNYLKTTLESALHPPVASGSSSGAYHPPNTQKSLVDDDFEPQPIISPTKLRDLLQEPPASASCTPSRPFTPTTDPFRPPRFEFTHVRSNAALKGIKRPRSTPHIGSFKQDTHSEAGRSRNTSQVSKDSVSEISETKQIDSETDDARADRLSLVMDSLELAGPKAPVGTDPQEDRGAGVPATRDMITGAMCAAEILQSLAGHGCQDISEKIDLSNVTDYPVSSGGFGDVYCATLNNGDRVGLKCIRVLVGPTAEGKKFLKDAAHELYVWSKCKHPNVLELSGVVIFRERIAMVSPWVENGHLRWFLAQGHRVDRWALCVQIIDGVDYLHGQGIVHGDLKPENILISEDHTPKLTDFGNAALAEYTLHFTNTSAAHSISARWTAPEILKQETKTTKAGDIFALGMIMFEAITGLLPYAGLSDPVVMFSIAAGKLPDRPTAHIPIGLEQADRLWEVVTSCWSYDPNERPKAQEVRIMMKTITPGGLFKNAD